MRSLRVLFLGLACALLAVPSLPASERGTTGAEFLKIGLGADAVGRGEAVTARAGSLSSLFYNPAGLSGLDSHEISATHLSWIAETAYEALAYARPSVDNGTLGLGIFWLHMPPIPARNALGQEDGSLQVYDLGIHCAYARDLSFLTGTPGWSAGAGIKVLRRELGGLSASGAAADLGALCQITETLTAGLSCQNLGYLSAFQSGSDHLPLTVRLGAQWQPVLAAGHALDVAADAVLGADQTLRGLFGLEYEYAQFLSMRLGYKAGTDTEGIMVGAGLRVEGWSLDYALKSMNLFGVTHYLTAGFRFGERIVKQQQDRSQDLLAEAETLFTQSRYEEALAVTEKAVVMDPRSSPAQQLRDKLKTVLDMLRLTAPAPDPGAEISVPALTPDEQEEVIPVPAGQEVKP